MHKRKYRIFAISIALGLIAWMIDNIFDYYIFYRPMGFWDLLIFNMPPHEAYIRSIILALFIIFGFYINRYIDRIEEAQGRYQQLFDSVTDAIFLITHIGRGLPGRIIEANRIAIEKLGYGKGELLHLSPPDLTDLKRLPEVSLMLEKLSVEGQILFETTLVSKEGRKIPVEINAHEVNLGGEVGFLSIIRDISERLEREKEIRRLASIPQYNPNPILEIDSNGVITYHNTAATDILQKLGVPEGPNAYLPEWKGVIEEIARHEGQQLCREVRIKDSIFAERIHLIPELDVVRIYATDITARMRGEKALQEAHSQLEKRVEERTRELAQANLELQREVEERTQAEAALRESEQQLRALTSQILSAGETERQRIATELHDELGQTLMLLRFKLSSFIDSACTRKDDFSCDYETLFNYLDGVIDNVRRLSRDLSTSVLDELGLSSALRYLLGEFVKHFHIASSSIEMDEIDRLLSPETQINVYRIFQESLTNIARHAQAQSIAVDIRKHDSYVAFVVEDDGKGFDVNQIADHKPLERRIGLAAMQERVRMAGGSLELWSQEGSGTRITFNIPINRHINEHVAI